MFFRIQLYYKIIIIWSITSLRVSEFSSLPKFEIPEMFPFSSFNVVNKSPVPLSNSFTASLARFTVS